jgi:septal ring factor EnvC (AmiA/AmiB activator)
MKRFISTFLALLIIQAGSTALAQSDMIIKQRAKNLANANNAEQEAPPAGFPAPPPAAPPAPPPSPAEQEIKRNLDKLEADLTAIKSGVDVSDDQKQTLQGDLDTLARGSVKPSKDSLSKLTDDLASALSATNASPRERGQLAQAVNVVVNSSMTTPSQAESFVVVAETALRSGGVDETGVQTISDDLKAILAEVQKKKPKLYQ